VDIVGNNQFIEEQEMIGRGLPTAIKVES